MKSKLSFLRVTPVISSGVIYASGDQLGAAQDLKVLEPVESGRAPGYAVRTVDKGIVLISLMVIDMIKQNADLDVMFFNSLPTLPGDNVALTISDADMAEKFLFSVSIAAGDYNDLAVNSWAEKSVEIPMASLDPDSGLIAVAVARATPTYTGVDELVFGYGARRE